MPTGADTYGWSWSLPPSPSPVVGQVMEVTVGPSPQRSGAAVVRLDGLAQWLVGPTAAPPRTPRVHLDSGRTCPGTLGAAADVANSGPGLGSSLVPGQPDAALLCAYRGGVGPGRPGALAAHLRLGSRPAAQLAVAVDAVSTDSVPGAFAHCPASTGAVVILAFGLPQGRTVDVWYAVGGCPSFDNGRIIAGDIDSATFQPAAALIEHLLPPGSIG